jgi:hypothetical protein
MLIFFEKKGLKAGENRYDFDLWRSPWTSRASTANVKGFLKGYFSMHKAL